MQVLDSEGRLFGYVNIIDALVVLFVVAVLVAGVALVTGGGGPDSSESTVSAEFATITIGPVSDDMAARLATTESLSLAGEEGTLNVTDAVRTPHPTRDAALVHVRTRLPDRSTNSDLSQQVAVSSGRFSYNATVSSLGNRSTIETRAAEVTVEAAVSERVAAAVSRGESFRVGGEPVATVTGVQLLDIRDGDRRLRVSLALQVARLDGVERFAQQPLRLGSSIPFRTDSYRFSGELLSRNRSIQAQQNLTVRTEAVVPNAVADSVEAGDEYALGGQAVADIESVAVYPVADGDRRRLMTTIRLRTTATDGQSEFLGQPVRVGSAVPFETASYQFDSTVTELNASGAGSPVDATFRVKWDNVSSELSDAVAPGLTEQHRGASATITDVERDPATVILRTESGEIYARDHPVNEDVTLTVSAQARQRSGRLVFHGRPVQTGNDIVLDFGSVTVRGTLVDATVDT